MSDSTTIKLSAPINRESGKPIEELNIRKPNVRELRGVKLLDVFQLDVNAILILIPRLVSPTITTAELDKLALSDIMELGSAITNFFAPSNQSPTT